MSIRTDLALECYETISGEVSGVQSKRHDSDGISVTHVHISTEEGAKRIGKPIGNYVTIEIDDLANCDDEIEERGADAVCAQLRKLLNFQKKEPVLVAGLGNRNITPDSIGPKAVDELVVTRHITREGNNGYDFDVRSVSAVAPGVLGLTGIETSEMIKAVVDKVKPSLVIAVDALASRKLSRLGKTVQICDTGISPGSGVGNNRKELTHATLGVPVIAIGVPMVVDAATLTIDSVENLSRYMKEKKGTEIKMAEELTGEQNRGFVKEILSYNDENMVVTPNDVDIISDRASKIIAEGINRALHMAL